MKLEKDNQNLKTSNKGDMNNIDNFSDSKYKQISLENEYLENNEDICPIEHKKTEEPIQLKIEEEITTEEKEKLEEAQEVVKKQSSKKKKWLNLLFFVINIGVVAGLLTYQLLNENNITSISDLASSINWWVVLLLVVIYGIITFLDSFRFWLLTYKATGKKRMGLCYRISTLGRYYDNITPFATGEQPFQIYYLNKHGVSGSESVSIPMGKYVIWQLSFVTFSLIIMVFSVTLNSFSSAGTAVVTAGSWIGFSINSALLLLVGIISISKKAGNKLITGILKFLHKIKLIKNYDKQYGKIMGLVNEYQTTMRTFAKDKWNFVLLLFVSYGFLILHYSLPFFIYASFYGFDFNAFFPILTYCLMIDLASGFLPLPGGTGAAELSFTALFATYFLDGNLFWAMLIWRIFTYYGPIIHGIGIIIYDYLIGNKRFQWERKKWSLEAESRSFEDNHLKDFELSLENPNKSKKKKERKL